MDIVRIATLDNEVEAALLGEILAGHGIPHAIHSFHDSAYDGIFQMQHGWGCVVGPEDQTGEIQRLLRDLRQSQTGG